MESKSVAIATSWFLDPLVACQKILPCCDSNFVNSFHTGETINNTSLPVDTMTTCHLKTKVQLTYKTEHTSNLLKEPTHNFKNKTTHSHKHITIFSLHL